jgi:hypothetical protein
MQSIFLQTTLDYAFNHALNRAFRLALALTHGQGTTRASFTRRRRVSTSPSRLCSKTRPWACGHTTPLPCARQPLTLSALDATTSSTLAMALADTPQTAPPTPVKLSKQALRTMEIAATCRWVLAVVPTEGSCTAPRVPTDRGSRCRRRLDATTPRQRLRQTERCMCCARRRLSGEVKTLLRCRRRTTTTIHLYHPPLTIHHHQPPTTTHPPTNPLTHPLTHPPTTATYPPPPLSRLSLPPMPCCFFT